MVVRSPVSWDITPYDSSKNALAHVFWGLAGRSTACTSRACLRVSFSAFSPSSSWIFMAGSSTPSLNALLAHLRMWSLGSARLAWWASCSTAVSNSYKNPMTPCAVSFSCDTWWPGAGPWSSQSGSLLLGFSIALWYPGPARQRSSMWISPGMSSSYAVLRSWTGAGTQSMI
jgi:hypothetical protein